MKYYYLYQITNNLNNKIYVGVHRTSNLDDGYMGSGKVIRRAVEKHGVENFTKVILETFENAEAMYAREKEIVNEEFLSRENVYNIRRGGFGGFDHLNDSSEAHIARTKNGYECSIKTFSPEQLAQNGFLGSEAARKRKAGIFSDGYVSPWIINPELQKMGNSPEAREKARASQKKTYAKTGHQQGEKNSNFGTCWISHELVGPKKCKKEDLPLYIEQGWVKGRSVFR